MKTQLRTPNSLLILKFILLYLLINEVYGFIDYLINFTLYDSYTKGMLVYDLIFAAVCFALLIKAREKVNLEFESANLSIIFLGGLFIFGFFFTFKLPSSLIFTSSYDLSLVLWLVMLFFLFSKPYKLLAFAKIPFHGNQLPNKEVIYKISLSSLFIIYSIFELTDLIKLYFFPVEHDEVWKFLLRDNTSELNSSIMSFLLFVFLILIRKRIINLILKQERESTDYLVVFVRLFFIWLFLGNAFFLFLNLFNQSAIVELVIAFAIISLIIVYPNSIVLPYYKFVKNTHGELDRNVKANTLEDMIGFTSLIFIVVNLLNFMFFLFEISQYALIIFGAYPSMENDFRTAMLVVIFNSAFAFIVFKTRHKIARYYSGRFKNDIN